MPSSEDLNSDYGLWHMLLGNMSEAGLMLLSKYRCRQKMEKLAFCEHYVTEKQSRVKFSTIVHKTKGTIDYIHRHLRVSLLFRLRVVHDIF